MPIDTTWFQEQMRSRGHTHRSLAAALGLPASAVSNLLHGKRQMTVEDACALSVALMIPILEIIRHAGFPFYEGHAAR